MSLFTISVSSEAVRILIQRHHGRSVDERIQQDFSQKYFYNSVEKDPFKFCMMLWVAEQRAFGVMDERVGLVTDEWTVVIGTFSN